MLVNLNEYQRLQSELKDSGTKLIAVSKTKSAEAITELFAAGQRDFGENYVQELLEKQQQLPAEIRWHFIGHLQRNKVKQILPFIYLIHGVDSERLLEEINKQAAAISKKVNVLLQVFIAKEESKFGLDEDELFEIIKEFKNAKYPNIALNGLMGMASLTDETTIIDAEFATLHSLYTKLQQALPEQPIDTLSMGMSSDYKIAMKNGSTMIRIGSALFGERNKN